MSLVLSEFPLTDLEIRFENKGAALPTCAAASPMKVNPQNTTQLLVHVFLILQLSGLISAFLVVSLTPSSNAKHSFVFSGYNLSDKTKGAHNKDEHMCLENVTFIQTQFPKSPFLLPYPTKQPLQMTFLLNVSWTYGFRFFSRDRNAPFPFRIEFELLSGQVEIFT